MQDLFSNRLEACEAFLHSACAFTGHRRKKLPWKNDETAPACAALKGKLAEQIIALTDKGIRYYISGMADGVDWYASEAVLALRDRNPEVKLLCVLPCLDQDERWSESDKQRYQMILRQADAVIYTSRARTKHSMLDRNRLLVRLSTVVLAVYNGEPRGGTAATIRYARKAGCELHIVHPVTLKCSYEPAKFVEA